MWFAIVLLASLLLASSYSPKKEVEDARVVGLGDNAFPTSKYGDKIPKIFGTREQKSPIVLWHGHFQPLANYEEVRSGLFSSDTVIKSYRYLIGFDLAICLGPGIILEQIKAEGGKVVWDGRGGFEEGGLGVDYANISIQGLTTMGGGIEFHPGNFAEQIPSPYMSSPSSTSGPNWQAGAAVANLPSYAGVCHAVFCQFYIGDDNAIPPRLSFVVKNLSKNLSVDYSVMANNQDVNPMEIVYSVLTEKWGMAGIDPAQIDVANFIECAHTLHTEDLGMSLLISGEKEVKDVIEECMRVADGVIYEDPATGLITCKLIRDDYTPGDLLVLDESNIVGKLEDYGRTSWEGIFNQVRVNYQSREMDYQSQVSVSQDFANIKYTDKVKSTSINLPGVVNSNTASRIGARELELLTSPLLKCTVTANRVAKDLRPGGVFKLNWAPYGMTDAIMRVVKIDLGDLLNNKISITCMQDKYSKDIVSFVFPTNSSHDNIDINAVEIDTYRLLNAPYFLLRDDDAILESDLLLYDNYARLLALCHKPDNNAVAFDVWAKSNENPRYSLSAGSEFFAGGGLLESPYTDVAGYSDGIDTTGTFIIYNVPQTTINQLPNYATFDEARDGSAMINLGFGDFMIYVGVNDLGGGRVSFDEIHRNILGVSGQNYAADSEVFFVKKGSGILKPLIHLTLNDMFYKFITRTPLGISDITAVTEYNQFFFSSRAADPLSPAAMTIDGARAAITYTTASTITVAWKSRSRKDPQLYSYMEDSNPDYDETLDDYLVNIVATDAGSPPDWTYTTSGTSLVINTSDFVSRGTCIVFLYAKRTDSNGTPLSSIPQIMFVNAT